MPGRKAIIGADLLLEAECRFREVTIWFGLIGCISLAWIQHCTNELEEETVSVGWWMIWERGIQSCRIVYWNALWTVFIWVSLDGSVHTSLDYRQGEKNLRSFALPLQSTSWIPQITDFTSVSSQQYGLKSYRNDSL